MQYSSVTDRRTERTVTANAALGCNKQNNNNQTSKTSKTETPKLIEQSNKEKSTTFHHKALQHDRQETPRVAEKFLLFLH